MVTSNCAWCGKGIPLDQPVMMIRQIKFGEQDEIIYLPVCGKACGDRLIHHNINTLQHYIDILKMQVPIMSFPSEDINVDV